MSRKQQEYMPFSPKVTADSFGKRAWREILAQIKVQKTKEYCMYFEFDKPKSWVKRSANHRRRLIQRLQREAFRCGGTSHSESFWEPQSGGFLIQKNDAPDNVHRFFLTREAL